MVEPLIHAKTEGGSTEFLAELGGEKSLINLTGSDGSLGNFEQSLMAQTCITTPDGIDRMRIGCVSNRQAILQIVVVFRRRSYRNLPMATRTGCVEHLKYLR